MLTTIKGYYENGAIVLTEAAPVTDKTEVIVTFLTENESGTATKHRTPGGLKGKVSMPDDFNEPINDLKDYM
jgi:hypothetical protein